jgi:hypothetical protein
MKIYLLSSPAVAPYSIMSTSQLPSRAVGVTGDLTRETKNDIRQALRH